MNQAAEKSNDATTVPSLPADSQPAPAEVESAVYAIADRSRQAARSMGRANRAWKDKALRAIGSALTANKQQILAANTKDVEAGRANGTSAALLDRLTLNDTRIAALAAALENLAGLPDPVGNVVRGQTLPNGLRLRQINVPMGVVAAIYEARPNVTVDIAGLALKSGNAVILRGGSAAAFTNEALIRVLREALESVGLPADAVQSVDQYGREGANVAHAGPRTRGRADSPRRPGTDPDRGQQLLRAGHRDRRGERPHLHRRVGQRRHGGGDPPQRQDAAPQRLQHGGNAPRALPAPRCCPPSPRR